MRRVGRGTDTYPRYAHGLGLNARSPRWTARGGTKTDGRAHQSGCQQKLRCMTASIREPTLEPTHHGSVHLIALSREYGAGGSELGLLLGERLGWPVLDRELAHRIAERLHCPCAAVEALDEHAPTLLERIAAAFTVCPSDAPILPDAPSAPDPDTLAKATRAVVLEAARTPPLIVIGHGAACLLQDRRDVLRVRVVAPCVVRVRRVATRKQMSLEQAAADVRRRDLER